MLSYFDMLLDRKTVPIWGAESGPDFGTVFRSQFGKVLVIYIKY